MGPSLFGTLWSRTGDGPSPLRTMGSGTGDGSITPENHGEQDWTQEPRGNRTGDGSITPENHGEQDRRWLHHPREPWGAGLELGPSPLRTTGSRTKAGSITCGCHRSRTRGDDASGSPRCAREPLQMFKKPSRCGRASPQSARKTSRCAGEPARCAQIPSRCAREPPDGGWPQHPSPCGGDDP